MAQLYTPSRGRPGRHDGRRGFCAERDDDLFDAEADLDGAAFTAPSPPLVAGSEVRRVDALR
ncbi:MAG: hypothetical protein M3238_05955, partial [Actinomycetota bacterium]|nr:hypothetical protein [Actinomycetota bacterium]